MSRSTAEIVREYGPFPGVDHVRGVTYDGQHVWFAAGDKLTAFDPASGKTLRSIDVAAHAGTAFDGQHLFQLAEDRIQKIDPKTGRVLATIPAPGGGGDSGLAWAEGTLWVGQYRDRKIHQVDPQTGAILRTVESNRFVTGVTWIDGELWHGTREGDESDLRQVDPRTGEVLERLEMPPGVDVSGLESDGAESVLLRRRKERESEGRPPAQAGPLAYDMLNGLPLIDAHVHVARLPTLNMPWERWTFSSRRDGDIRALYDERGTAVPKRFDTFFESEGVDCALLLTEYSPRVTGIQPVEDILPLVEFNPKRMRLIANVNPHLHFPAEREARRQLDLGAVALKIHPCHGNFAANDAELYRTYALCAERGVPVVFHCGTSNFPGAVNRYAGPELMEDVARSFPDLTIVLAHGGRGWWYETAGFLTLMRENLWIEISGLPPQRLPQYFGRFDFERIAQRFIFGTDWPGTPGIRANAEAFAALGLPRETLANVLAGNAISVYRLAPEGSAWPNQTRGLVR